MKRIILILTIFLSFFLIYNYNKKDNDYKKVEKQEIEEKKAIFISYIELQKYLKNKDTEESKNNIEKMISKIKKSNFNMILLQVRTFSDSIYESDYFPWSSVIASNEGVSPGYDILNYFIEKSHSNNIEIHAWINPYRIRNNNDINSISDKNMAYKWLNTNNVKVTEKGIYYNPASEEVQELILNGVEEIVKKYEVDGIHFDDYFYPCNDIDIENYNEYKKNSEISLNDYHLLMVNNLIKKVHKIAKENNVLFGISPDGNIENNYNKNYADIYSWGNSNEYVDYLMPQVYYGFYNEVKPFYEVINEWDEVVKTSKVKIIPALSLYKSGNVDKYAKSGEKEWIENDDIIMRQILLSRNIKSYDGFAIFRYDYMFDDNIESINVLNEIKNIKSIIKK